MPIMLMTMIDGAAHTQWGAGGMLYTEALIGMAGIAVFIAVTAATASAVAPDSRLGAERRS